MINASPFKDPGWKDPDWRLKNAVESSNAALSKKVPAMEPIPTRRVTVGASMGRMSTRVPGRDSLGEAALTIGRGWPQTKGKDKDDRHETSRAPIDQKGRRG